MTDSSAGDGQPAAPTGTEAPHLQVLAQYLKDLSFENPNAPQSVLGSGEAPKIEVSVDVGVRAVGDGRYEVELRVTAHANRQQHKAFVVEVQYAGLFALNNVAPDSIKPVCLIECPRLLFPFVRRIIADATRDGGFPPLLLEPLDFAALYRQQEPQPQASAPAGNGVDNA